MSRWVRSLRTLRNTSSSIKNLATARFPRFPLLGNRNSKTRRRLNWARELMIAPRGSSPHAQQPHDGNPMSGRRESAPFQNYFCEYTVQGGIHGAKKCWNPTHSSFLRSRCKLLRVACHMQRGDGHSDLQFLDERRPFNARCI